MILTWTLKSNILSGVTKAPLQISHDVCLDVIMYLSVSVQHQSNLSLTFIKHI